MQVLLCVAVVWSTCATTSGRVRSSRAGTAVDQWAYTRCFVWQWNGARPQALSAGCVTGGWDKQAPASGMVDTAWFLPELRPPSSV